AAQSDLAAELQKAKDEAATIERELSASLHAAEVARDQLQSQIDALAAKVEEKDREVTDVANAAQATKADLTAQLKAAREEAASNLKAKLSGGEAADRLQRKVAELEVANDELQASKTDVESQLKSREEAVEGLQSRLADLEAKRKHFEDLVSTVRNE
ncbi:ANKRD17, partial [Symbiodinium sp. CCMP2592]